MFSHTNNVNKLKKDDELEILTYNLLSGFDNTHPNTSSIMKLLKSQYNDMLRPDAILPPIYVFQAEEMDSTLEPPPIKPIQPAENQSPIADTPQSPQQHKQKRKRNRTSNPTICSKCFIKDDYDYYDKNLIGIFSNARRPFYADQFSDFTLLNFLEKYLPPLEPGHSNRLKIAQHMTTKNPYGAFFQHCVLWAFENKISKLELKNPIDEIILNHAGSNTDSQELKEHLLNFRGSCLATQTGLFLKTNNDTMMTHFRTVQENNQSLCLSLSKEELEDQLVHVDHHSTKIVCEIRCDFIKELIHKSIFPEKKFNENESASEPAKKMHLI